MKVYREYDIELYSEYNHCGDNDFDLINVISVEDNVLEGIFLCRNYHCNIKRERHIYII